MTRFYHYTSHEHLAAIRTDRVILPGESNVGSPLPALQPFGKHFGPAVVWLLDTPDLGGHPHGLIGSVFDKTAVRIAVDVPAIKWFDWPWASKMNLRWFNSFVQTGGGPEAANHWYVHPAPIRDVYWVTIDHLKR